ncbi:MAG: WbqC family protein [Alteromonadaceae bacterium]|nr:WbqC family protein [Alteromonadaceae bacterium]
MKIGIMQPYLFPYIGYFQLIQAVDIFVFLDDVNYIKRGYINRNEILLNGHPHRFTKPVNQVSQNRFINQHQYSKQCNLITVFEQAYKNAPNYTAIMPMLTSILNASGNVAYVNGSAIKLVFEYLGLHKQFAFSSEIEHDTALRGQDKIIAICKAVDALTYVNPPGGRSLYDEITFARAGLELTFLSPELGSYPQLSDEFIPSLSLIDMLMMNSEPAIVEQLNDYKLLRE